LWAWNILLIWKESLRPGRPETFSAREPLFEGLVIQEGDLLYPLFSNWAPNQAKTQALHFMAGEVLDPGQSFSEKTQIVACGQIGALVVSRELVVGFPIGTGAQSFHSRLTRVSR